MKRCVCAVGLLVVIEPPSRPFTPPQTALVDLWWLEIPADGKTCKLYNKKASKTYIKLTHATEIGAFFELPLPKTSSANRAPTLVILFSHQLQIRWQACIFANLARDNGNEPRCAAITAASHKAVFARQMQNSCSYYYYYYYDYYYYCYYYYSYNYYYHHYYYYCYYYYCYYDYYY